MELSSRLEEEYLQAYKSKDSIKVAVLRMVKTAIKNKQVELGRAPNSAELLELLGKEAKKRQESIDLYNQAGRTDLAEKETRELGILKEYLPAPLTEQELLQIVDAAISTLGAVGMKDMGRVMQAVMEENKGRVDGKALSTLVRTRLSS